MIKRYSFIGIIATILGFGSCETEFSLNGDFELTPVVIGLLDQSQSTHVFKITKAFLGDGNNLEFAKIPDSSYFNVVDARVIEYDPFGEATGRQWLLQDSTINNKSTDGIFYGPEQRIYYFNEDSLNSENEYEFIADLNEGEASIRSRTTLIDKFSIASIVSTNAFTIRFANTNVDDNDDYLRWSFNINQGFNAARYEVGYSFSWTEEYTDGTTSSFSSPRRIERIEQQADPDSPVPINGIISGFDFFQYVRDNVPDDESVVRRTFDGLNLIISIAHRDLAQYMDVSQPVSGIAQVQPEFTNIEGGLGLFSSRLLFRLENIKLSASTIQELAIGQFTASKSFCSQLPQHNDEPFFCP